MDEELPELPDLPVICIRINDDGTLSVIAPENMTEYEVRGVLETAVELEREAARDAAYTQEDWEYDEEGED